MERLERTTRRVNLLLLSVVYFIGFALGILYQYKSTENQIQIMNKQYNEYKQDAEQFIDSIDLELKNCRREGRLRGY